MKKDFKKIVNFLFEVGTSRNVFRSHRQTLRNTNDSIADHSFRAAIIGLILSEMEGVDENKVIKMCLLHDLAELRTGDANFINKFYQKQEEDNAIKEQWQKIPQGEKIILLLEEYNKRKTREAIVAKDADLLDQILLQKEYLLERPGDFKKWHLYTEKQLKTKSAKKIAFLIFKTNPLEWLYAFAKSKKVM